MLRSGGARVGLPSVPRPTARPLRQGHIGRYGLVPDAGRKGHDYGEVSSGLFDLQTPDDVGEDILLTQVQANAPRQHSDGEQQSVEVQPLPCGEGSCSLALASACGNFLIMERRVPSMVIATADPHIDHALSQEGLWRLSTSIRPLPAFRRRRPRRWRRSDSSRCVAGGRRERIAFEVEDGVDDVLEDLWTGDGTLFATWPTRKTGCPAIWPNAGNGWRTRAPG